PTSAEASEGVHDHSRKNGERITSGSVGARARRRAADVAQRPPSGGKEGHVDDWRAEFAVVELSESHCPGAVRADRGIRGCAASRRGLCTARAWNVRLADPHL